MASLTWNAVLFFLAALLLVIFLIIVIFDIIFLFLFVTDISGDERVSVKSPNTAVARSSSRDLSNIVCNGD